MLLSKDDQNQFSFYHCLNFLGVLLIDFPARIIWTDAAAGFQFIITIHYSVPGYPDGCRKEQPVKSILIKDTTREEREELLRSSLDCGGGCENCSSCWLGGGNPWEIYQDYIDGKREIWEINQEYNERYLQGRLVK